MADSEEEAKYLEETKSQSLAGDASSQATLSAHPASN
jgi:hypothetical protein